MLVLALFHVKLHRVSGTIYKLQNECHSALEQPNNHLKTRPPDTRLVFDPSFRGKGFIMWSNPFLAGQESV